MAAVARWSWLVAPLALAGAGCLARPADPPAALVEFTGWQAGTDSARATCEEWGKVRVTTQLARGVLVVKVFDGDGTPVHGRLFEGQLEEASPTLYGESGSWRLEAHRGPGFLGSYRASLSC